MISALAASTKPINLIKGKKNLIISEPELVVVPEPVFVTAGVPEAGLLVTGVNVFPTS